jgi:hypothetical protein
MTVGKAPQRLYGGAPNAVLNLAKILGRRGFRLQNFRAQPLGIPASNPRLLRARSIRVIDGNLAAEEPASDSGCRAEQAFAGTPSPKRADLWDQSWRLARLLNRRTNHRMKKLELATALLMVSLAAPNCLALSDAQTKAVKKAIVSVSTPEIPAKAAELVTKASAEDQEAVAVTAVRAAIYRSRTSASLVVAAVSKAKPELAATAVRTASEMESNQSDAIASAAIIAAPEAKAHIVASANAGMAAAAVAPSAATFSPGMPVPLADVPTFAASSDHVFAGHSPSVVEVHTSDHPINGLTGGNGHGRFETSPPHGGNPPGLNGQPGRHGPPAFVDYTKPRER